MRYLLVLLALALPLCAERINVPLRDPSRPALVKVSTINGNIQIKAHTGKDVIVELDDSPPRTQPAPNGMKQILTGAGGVNVEEENNVVTIKSPHGNGSYVCSGAGEEFRPHPFRQCGRSYGWKASVEGEINADTVNGSIFIVDASGPVVAHSLNGRLTANMKHVPSGRPMSFSTMNGQIDLTLPADAKAELRINNQRGETYSDFEVQVSSSMKRTESGRDRGPKYRLDMERTVTAQVNGGGPEIAMRSMNGTIYIRKAK